MRLLPCLPGHTRRRAGAWEGGAGALTPNRLSAPTRALARTLTHSNLTLSFSCSHPGPAPLQQIDPSQPLPRQAAIRGPYTNTGSRDVGLDPRPKLTPPKL